MFFELFSCPAVPTGVLKVKTRDIPAQADSMSFAIWSNLGRRTACVAPPHTRATDPHHLGATSGGECNVGPRTPLPGDKFSVLFAKAAGIGRIASPGASGVFHSIVA